MKLRWNLDGNTLVCGDERFDITCDVRNELNGRRRLHDPDEVIKSVDGSGHWGKPYMPRRFPRGTWPVLGAEDTREKDFRPVKIRTGAHQQVRTWVLDDKGGYDHPGESFVEDYGYHLHYSWSNTTLGCGRLATEGQVRRLAELVRTALAAGDTVLLEVY
jgi:hypothetical protein